MGEAGVQSIVEVRKDPVFCPVSREQMATKTSYFLRPSYKESCVGGARSPHPPPLRASSFSLMDGRGRQLLGKTTMKDLPIHSKAWVEWVNLMEPRHRDTWEKSGIYDAIKGSTCRIIRDSGLLVALVKKWCSGTNTFVFSWGEATVTLEDVFVLGGYPIRGSPVFASVEDEEMRDVEKRMRLALTELRRGAGKNTHSSNWMKMFKGSGSDIEHEAFLAFWMSRFLFLVPWDRISAKVFPLAIRLARGEKLALAPAVLAGIYRDLSFSAKCICGLAAPAGHGNTTAWLQSNILQVWAWERFLFLETMPKEICPDKPRISRWDEVRNLKRKKVAMDLDMNIGKDFEWRPYVKDVRNFKCPNFYPEEGRLVILDSDHVEDEVLAFARCLVPCELVGIDCIEQYLPHRVAMQFGMDQDIPGHVDRCNENHRAAWEVYDLSFRNSSLYITPRYYKPGMNESYRDWLGSRSSGGMLRKLEEDPEQSNGEKDDDDAPLSRRRTKIKGVSPVPLGRDVGELNGEDDDDDNLPLSQLRTKRKGVSPVPLGQNVGESNGRKHNTGRSCASGGGGNLSKKDNGVAASPRDAVAVDEEPKGESMPIDPTPEVALDEEPKGETVPADPTHKEVRVVQKDNDPAMDPIHQQEAPGTTAWRSWSTFEVDMLELELSAWISKLESNVAAIQAARQNIADALARKETPSVFVCIFVLLLVGSILHSQSLLDLVC